MIDTTKAVTELTDGELDELLKLEKLLDGAQAERDRRKEVASSTYIGTRPVVQACVKRSSEAPCPGCGRRDAVTHSKTLYATPRLARGGEPIGEAAHCACGAWYDPGSGKPASLEGTYTY